jgi:hypothetical protein
LIANVVSHARHVAVRMAETAMPRNFFADIPRMIVEIRPPPIASKA